MPTAPTTTEPSPEKKVIIRVCASKQFPGKLHDLLTYAENSGLEWIISWVHDGKAVMVHRQDHLLQILPIFFGQTKFRSFQRQLNVSMNAMVSIHTLKEGSQQEPTTKDTSSTSD
jgi:hypothetical protein